MSKDVKKVQVASESGDPPVSSEKRESVKKVG